MKPPEDVVRIGEFCRFTYSGHAIPNLSRRLFRAAQRAFRERKQEQLAELQARLQQYEQGEIERNVALQSVAKRLKEDNEKLRLENNLLKARIGQMEDDKRGSSGKKRRESPLSFSSAADVAQPARKRHRSSGADAFPSPTFSVPTPYSPAYAPPSPTSTASIPDTCLSSLDHMPSFEQQAREMSVMTDFAGVPYDPFFDFTSPASLPQSDASMDAAMQMNVFGLGCGLCNHAQCVCGHLDYSAPADKSSAGPLKFELDTDALNFDLSMLPPTPVSMPSILENLPPYQPPVPLRRRTTNPNLKPIFPVVAPTQDCPVGAKGATCSGDPANCLACADDQFGQAFCAAIGQSLASSAPCANCPSLAAPAGTSPAGSGCCGNPGGCCRASPASSAATASPIAAPTPHLAGGAPPETIPCDDAWRQIKAQNPQVSFADLTLLAEVVARRSKCTGPRVVISPALGSITPERAHMSPVLASRAPSGSGMSEASMYGGAPPAYQEQPSSSSAEIRIQCGKPSVRELPAEAVRDAMRLLDIMYPRN